jgi:hypothetical protein
MLDLLNSKKNFVAFIIKIKIMPKKSLSFFITINKLTDELILQEGGLISLKIPKQ